MDERRVSEYIFANAPLIWPAAAIAASLLLSGSSTWLAASAYLALAALFIWEGWDAKALFGYGLLMLFASALSGFNGDFSDRIAEGAYWLFIGGLARLAWELAENREGKEGQATPRKGRRLSRGG